MAEHDYEEGDLAPCLWTLPSTKKWYVGMINEQSCAGADFIDCHCWDTVEYDSLAEAISDTRLQAIAKIGVGQ